MLAVCLCFLMLPGLSPAATPQVGKVTFMLNAKTPFESMVTDSTPEQQSWMRSAYWRARAYPPFYDRALPWSPPAYLYKDLYAIYRDHEQSYLKDHPDWVLRDAQGRPLYIPYGCGSGSCPQYAADVGSAQWRQHWIDEVKSEMGKGYIGVHVDDVNLSMSVGNGNGDAVRPIDPRTGQSMTDVAWKGYVVDFLAEIRRQLPDAWISHNPVWSESESDPYVQREVAAADAIELERGFSDPGFTQATGKYGFETFLDHIDWLHGQGKSVILQPYNLDTAAKREFEVASYFLIQQGDDAITSDDRAYPDNWWQGWATDIGTPKGERYSWHGLLRRDFAEGFVLVNSPGAETKKVELGGTFENLAGEQIQSLTIPAGRGFVVRGLGDVSLGSVGSTTRNEPTSTRIAVDRRRAQVTRQIRTLGNVRWTAKGKVRLKLMKRSTRLGPSHRRRRGWHATRVSRTRVSGGGNFTQTFRHLHPGRYRIRARFTGAKDKKPSRSRSITVRIG